MHPHAQRHSRYVFCLVLGFGDNMLVNSFVVAKGWSGGDGRRVCYRQESHHLGWAWKDDCHMLMSFLAYTTYQKCLGLVESLGRT
jgi:hypothetical protein